MAYMEYSNRKRKQKVINFGSMCYLSCFLVLNQ
jgi:hypothetical protein